jgi:predicted nucleic acid-binding protein
VQLVDTSAWIEIFRRGSTLTVEDIVDDRDAIVTCLPVIQEVLQGFDDQRAFQIAETAMYALPCLDATIGRGLIDAAVDLYRRARRSGVTVRSGIDCLVAASALRHGATVVHCDRDYAHLTRIVPLQQIDISARLKSRRRS